MPVLVGGSAADFADQGASIAATLPIALAILVAVTVLVLWLLTGSSTPSSSEDCWFRL